jgi:hypothetical protein
VASGILPEEGPDPFEREKQIEMLVEMAKDTRQWRNIKPHVNEARHEQIEKTSKVRA